MHYVLRITLPSREVIMPIPIDQFKYVMRQWISGVSIVTMQTGERGTPDGQRLPGCRWNRRWC
jgi:hypothetical protein